MPLQVRRGTNAQRQAMAEPLASGELLYTTDTGTLYIGNGSTLGGVPVANVSSQDIKDISASVFTGGAHSGITFTYDSVSGTIDAVVDQDLSNYQGVIRASAFSGSLVADDSSLLVDAINGSINLNGTVKGNIVPDTNEAYDLGTSGLRFKDLYLSGSSLYLGSAVISSTGSAVDLPAGSTVGGILIGSGTGIGDGVVPGSNYNINIVGDDSTIIVNSQTKVVTAAGGFIGDLTGTADSAVAAQTVDITDDFGLATRFYPTFVENRSAGDTLRASIDVVYKSDEQSLNAPNIVGENVFGVLFGLAGSVITGDVTGVINGLEGSTIIGTFTGDTIGSHVGSVVGDLQGSVLASDSSVIVNSVSNAVTSLSVTGGTVTLTGNKMVTDTSSDFRVETAELVIDHITNDITFDNPKLRFNAARGSLLSPTVVQNLDTLGTISAYGYNGADYVLSALIIVAVDDTSITTSSTEIKTVIGIGQASELINDTGKFLKVDSVGHTTVPSIETTGYLQSAVYADPTARDAAITAPASGMMVFLTDSTGSGGAPKFQGYISGTGWVDLN